MDKKILLIVIVVVAIGAAVYFINIGSEGEGDIKEENGTNTETIVSYTSAGYKPKDITVFVGTTVTFVNNSSNPMWTASDPHPVHSIKPEFNSLESVTSGGQYSFTFIEVGTWRYHNHMLPNHTGSVTVQ